MRRSDCAIWFVQAVSLSRLGFSLLFATIAFQNVPTLVVATIYFLAMGSDLIDGFAARKLEVSTYAGKILDLISDKSLTIVSLLYAAERGVSLLPLALIACREVVVLGLRAIVVQGTQLLPTNRSFGGSMAAIIWGNTFALLWVDMELDVPRLVHSIYWASSIVLSVNLGLRVCSSRHRVMAALRLIL